jgi:SAM-dependent methyltransferase
VVGQLRNCEVCGGSHTIALPKLSIDPWPLVSCADCGFVFLHSVPGYAALVEDYAWEKTWAAEKKRRKSKRSAWLDAATRWRLIPGKYLDKFRSNRALGATGNVLDIGCGEGNRLPMTVTPFGIEISAGLAEKSRPAFEAKGGTVVCAPAVEALETFDDDFFSAILMRSYLEHEEKPRAVLAKAFKKLKPGGVIYVRVPDFNSINRHLHGVNWCGIRSPDHVNYFTTKTLSALASSIGFQYSRKNWHSLFDDNLIVELTKPISALGDRS